MTMRTEMSWTVGGAAAGRREAEGVPARVVVLGRWDGQLDAAQARAPHDRAQRPAWLTLERFDDQMALSAPMVHTAIGPVSAAGFEAMHPDELVQRVPLLQQLMALRRQLRDPAQFESAARIVRAWQGPPAAVSPAALPQAQGATSPADDIERLLGRPASVASPAASGDGAALDQWVASMVRPHLAPQAPAQSEALIELVNQALSAALTALLHDTRWQAFESLWRGADWLLRRLDTEQLAGVTLVDLSWAELAQDLSQGTVSAALRAALQPMVAEEGAPVLTHVVVHEPVQLDEAAIQALRALVALGAEHGAQVLACPNLQQFFDRQGVLQSQVQAAWGQCRQASGEGLQMVAPRFVLRHPYGPGSDPISWLDYREPLASAQGDAVLWGHPGWLVLANDLAEGSGTVADLPHVVLDEQDGAGTRLLTTEWPLNATLADLLGQFGVRAVVAHASRAAVQLR